jgi:hypothetical protein
MARDGIDCWLVHDFRGNNPVLHQLLGEKKNNTRRCFLFIPVNGEPVFIAHLLDKDLFSNLGFRVELYSGWQKLEKIKSSIGVLNRSKESPWNIRPAANCP